MRRLSLLAVPVLIALLAGCGSSNSSSTAATSPSTTPPTQTSAAVTVKTASNGTLGTILVDGSGRTLYLFAPDKGNVSTCYGACASAWPPLTTGTKAAVAGSAMSSQLATAKRKDGTLQVTYAGHPLYRFAGDSSAGQANGQGLDAQGGKWWVLSASGKQVDTSNSGSSGGGSSSGGY